MLRAMVRRVPIFLAAFFLGCSPAKPPEKVEPPPSPIQVSLVESEPAETTLDRPDILNASEVWLEMFRHAKRSIDVAEFYASEADAQWISSSKLAPVVQALADAHKRGVIVRFLLDEKFVPQYTATLELLEKSGLTIRRIKSDALFGGVQHAKYFVIDGESSFIGSQNFDWRALDHIQEMGVRLHSSEIAQLLEDIFETDWALAGGAPPSTRIHHAPSIKIFPAIEADKIEFVASPKGWLPDETEWELPRIINMLDQAKQSIQVQVLKYKTQARNGNRFTDLDDALRRAAMRGVKIQMIISEWGFKDNSLAALHEASPNIDIRYIKIPPFSGGEIPFARVAHAKYLIVDQQVAWIGTSNWEDDYFTRCRNVGVIVQSGRIPVRLAQFFQENWKSEYVLALPAETSSPAVKPSSAQ